MNAILLHGMPEEWEYFDPNEPSVSNAHWFPWLQKQLTIKGVNTQTPEVPNSYKPDWQTWVKEIERYDIDEETMLVGHSCGGGFWVRYLSEHPELIVGKVVLVAPWLDPDGDETGDFFNFTIDSALVSRTKGVTIFHSANDMGNIHKSVATLREKIKDLKYVEFENYGHFCEADMKSKQFPELLEEILA